MVLFFYVHRIYFLFILLSMALFTYASNSGKDGSEALNPIGDTGKKALNPILPTGEKVLNSLDKPNQKEGKKSYGRKRREPYGFEVLSSLHPRNRKE
jgi:hypothetical protein